jgi:hypothetical protein
MQDDTYQALWEIERTDSIETSGIINSLELLSLAEWTRRIERAVASLDIADGQYPLKVRLGGLMDNKWTVVVRREASIVPY